MELTTTCWGFSSPLSSCRLVSEYLLCKNIPSNHFFFFLLFRVQGWSRQALLEIRSPNTAFQTSEYFCLTHQWLGLGRMCGTRISECRRLSFVNAQTLPCNVNGWIAFSVSLQCGSPKAHSGYGWSTGRRSLHRTQGRGRSHPESGHGCLPLL